MFSNKFFLIFVSLFSVNISLGMEKTNRQGNVFSQAKASADAGLTEKASIKCSSLIIAINENEYDKISALLTKCPQLLQYGDETGNTPLHLAALNSDQKTLNILLLAGADRNAQNQRGLTPAAGARERGREENSRFINQWTRLGAMLRLQK